MSEVLSQTSILTSCIVVPNIPVLLKARIVDKPHVGMPIHIGTDNTNTNTPTPKYQCPT